MPVLPESSYEAIDAPGEAAVLANEPSRVEGAARLAAEKAKEDACLLGVAARPLAFRVHGSDHHGQVVRIAGQKCAIGASPGCTFRLRGVGAAPLSCLILRSDSAAAVRRWSLDTRLNGRAFNDAPLHLGDRLAIGPLELEVIEGAPARVFSGGGSPPTSEEVLSETDQTKPRQFEEEETWRRQIDELELSLERVRRQRDALLTERLALEAKQAEIPSLRPSRGDDVRRTEIYSGGECGDRPAITESFEADLAEREANSTAAAESQGHEVETLKRERAALTQELASARAAWESDHAAWEDERNRLALQTQTLQTERDELVRQRDIWLRERAVLESGRLALATEVAALGDAHSALEELARERSESERIVSEAAADKALLEAEVARLKQQLQDLQTAWNDERSELTKAASHCEAQAPEAADKASLEAELVRLNLELRSQQSSWSDERAKLIEASAGREAQAEQISEQLTSQLKRQLAEAHEECEALQRERDSLAAQRNLAQMQRDSLTEEVNRLTAEVEALSARIESHNSMASNAIPSFLDGDRVADLGIDLAGAPSHGENGAKENVSGTYILPQGFSGFAKVESPESMGSFDSFAAPAVASSLLAPPAYEADFAAGAGAREPIEEQSQPIGEEHSSSSFHEAVRPITFTEPAPLLAARHEEDGEESIEEYMQRLLMRARGEQAPLSRTTGAAPAVSIAAPSPPPPVKTAAPIAAPPVDASPSGVSSSSSADKVAPASEGAGEFSPRSTAPELSIDLAAMREVANSTTRSAIDDSMRRRGAAENWAKLGLGFASLAGASWLAVASGGQPNLKLLAAGVGAIGGAYSIGRAGLALWKRRKSRRRERG